jgi:hypothetical protein
MFFSSLLERFIEKSPIAVMSHSTIIYALNATALDDLFREHASAQYEHKITFSALVDLLSLVVCQIYTSVNSAYITSARNKITYCYVRPAAYWTHGCLK